MLGLQCDINKFIIRIRLLVQLSLERQGHFHVAIHLTLGTETAELSHVAIHLGTGTIQHRRLHVAIHLRTGTIQHRMNSWGLEDFRDIDVEAGAQGSYISRVEVRLYALQRAF